jgi:hypothetical protein
MASEPAKKKRSKRDIQRPHWDPPSWRPENVLASLENLQRYAEENAQEAIDWYYIHKSTKNYISQWLRAFAIIATATAGLMPIIVSTGIFSRRLPLAEAQLRDLHAQQIGYLCFGLAALLLAFDHYFGISAGWMRYMATGLALETTLEQFRLDWARITAPLGGKVPAGQELQGLIQRIADFGMAVRSLVENETQAWATDLQSSLSQLEKETKDAVIAAKANVESAQKNAEAQQRAASPGAIDLTIGNVQEIEGGYAVALDGNVKKENVTNKTCGLLPVSPGLHDVSVEATIAGGRAYASQIVYVQPDTAAKVTLSLSRDRAVAKNA